MSPMSPAEKAHQKAVWAAEAMYDETVKLAGETFRKELAAARKAYLRAVEAEEAVAAAKREVSP